VLVAKAPNQMPQAVLVEHLLATVEDQVETEVTVMHRPMPEVAAELVVIPAMEAQVE
jgi:hypothetical protein